METNGTTRAEMQTMDAIISLSQTAEDIKTALDTQNELLKQLVDAIQQNKSERSNN